MTNSHEVGLVARWAPIAVAELEVVGQSVKARVVELEVL
jgi:hypothetical protein